jgi:hypothetical protein
MMPIVAVVDGNGPPYTATVWPQNFSEIAWEYTGHSGFMGFYVLFLNARRREILGERAQRCDVKNAR